MPEEFPKLNLDSPQDLDHVMTSIREYALNLADNQPAEVRQALVKAIDQWITTARIKLEPNILVNGMTFSEYNKQAKEVEPFDEMLSVKVQNLSQEADKLTEQVISYRKRLPSERVAAMERREKVLESLQRKVENERRGTELESRAMLVDLPEIKVDLERKPQVAETLRKAVDEINSLQVSLIEQATAADEQTRLVKRLRTMPP
ncbi:hypothetical protein IE53DRAFT_390776 [Violaceomyces palustris]|uniref:Uncharacterized protein n=1 Tax=Violaceomyces palustris TaxID=1673888 RepID=A0ACD0NMP7_9BASI|nr:hypothetical protein IE53DRAFT_390776 [Violaceomyces palustris]